MQKKVLIAGMTAIVVALAIFIGLVYTFAINLPQWDDYDSCLGFLNAFVQSHGFTQKFLILMDQHQEHRLVITKLIELISYKLLGHVNFRLLTFIGGFLLLACLLPLFLLAKEHLSSKKLFLVMVLFTGLVLCPSQYGATLWVCASLQQYSQMFCSLFALYYLLKLEKDDSHLNKGAYIAFCIANALAAAGWIAFMFAAMIYSLIRKNKKLFALNILLGVVIAIPYFLILPYHHTVSHQFTSFSALAKFILGFTGSTFFCGELTITGGMISFLISIPIMATILFNIEKIFKSPFFLSWYLFFFATAFLVGLSRLSFGDNGLDSRYALYSLINLGVTIQLRLKKDSPSVALGLISLATLMNISAGLMMLAFLHTLGPVTLKFGPYEDIHQSRTTPLIDYQDTQKAINIYKESRALKIYRNNDIDKELAATNHTRLP